METGRVQSVNPNYNNIALSGSLGGTPFDYFLDRGTKRVAIYGSTETVAVLYEQAFWVGIEVVGVYGPSSTSYRLDYGEVHGTPVLNVSVGAPPPGIPVILCNNPPTPMGNGVLLSELYQYSRQKRILFDNVINYKKQVSPGLKVVVMSLPSLWYVRNRSEYENYLLSRDKSKQNYTEPYVFPALGKDAEYAKDVDRGFNAFEKNGVYFLQDFTSKYANCTAGYRVTTDLPDHADRTIYFFGNSVCFGMKSDDEHTIQSVVQREINKDPDVGSYKVLNCGNGGHPNYSRMWKSIEYHRPGNDDVIFLMGWFSKLTRDVYQDRVIWLWPQVEEHIFDRPHLLGDYVYADPIHYTYIGYEALGMYVARKLLSDVLNNEAGTTSMVKQASTPVISNSMAEAPQELVQYIDSIREVAPRIGSIVMNCNPFTLGHRYLIEESARKVTQLIVFVVEEDKSIFPFVDRLELVKQGTADLPNVTVVPSGGFIISQTTFGAYFEKDSRQEETIDPTMDVEIFALFIAPALGITIRFAGEEPLDRVTRQYNEAMQLILPKYGIDFEVIRRKESGGAVISASRVRKLLQTKEFDQISQIVPKTTLDYLVRRFGEINP